MHMDNNGWRVDSVEDLDRLAFQRRSVIGVQKNKNFSSYIGWAQKPKPASFLMNMNCAMITKAIRKGIYLYEKRSPTN